MNSKNKLKTLFFSALNFIVIAGIIAFIIIGVWRIGILEAPEFIENLFFPSDGDAVGINENTEDFLEQNPDDNEYEITKVELNSETVRQLLSSVAPTEKYSHDFQYTLVSDENTVTKKVTVIEQDGISCAYFVSQDGTVNKQITEAYGITTVNTLAGQALRSESYNSGDINFSEQIGAIITHKDFLEAADDPNYSFSLATSDEGTIMLINFTTKIDSYSQFQSYKFNLDYGVVTEAKCYENNNLIYSLTTNSLTENTVTSLNIPSQFTDFLSAIEPPVRTEEAPQEEQE